MNKAKQIKLAEKLKEVSQKLFEVGCNLNGCEHHDTLALVAELDKIVDEIDPTNRYALEWILDQTNRL